jgi:hypothetical protein
MHGFMEGSDFTALEWDEKIGDVAEKFIKNGEIAGETLFGFCGFIYKQSSFFFM